ncbi:MAG: preprotein translocase subunit SecE [Clostridiales bacterium]|nr:preprotein translocase subunit SecE [Clostridiales bacterium]
MAKKVENDVVIENNDKNTKSSKNKDVKAQKKAKKDKKEKKSVTKKSKEMLSELKKVSWPSFGKVVKTTGVVLLVVTICTLILFGADRLFSWLIFDLLLG